MNRFKSIAPDELMEREDYYKILGLTYECSVNEIISSFRSLVKKHHPDLTGNSDHSTFDRIVEAYKTLSIADEREIYNKKIGLESRAVPKDPLNPEPNYSDTKENQTFEIRNMVLEKKRVQFAFQMDELARRGLLRKRLKTRDLERHTKRRFDISVTLTRHEQEHRIILPIDLPAKIRCPQCQGDAMMSSICAVCDGRGQITEMKTAYIAIPPYIPTGSILSVNLRSINPGGLAYFRSRSLRVRILSDL